MSTVSLQMIVKDEVDEVVDLIRHNSVALEVFDEINLTVSDKRAANKLSRELNYPKVNIVWREWNNRFDEARNDNVALCTSDYYFWLDCDDTFDFRAIPQLVELADEHDYDQIMLPYNYAQNDEGECVAFHWRERLLRTSHPFTWKGWVHETPITNLPFKAHRVSGVEVKHTTDNSHTKDSLDRNHKILLEATKESDDPRYQLYLGTSHHARGEYGEAIVILDAFTKVSGSVSDIYRALCCMSECAQLMDVPTQAINYALKASALLPDHPQAFYLLAQWEAEQSNWADALEWVNVSEIKADPDDMSVHDPTSRHRSWLVAAQCEFMLKNYNAGLAWLRKLPSNNTTAQELMDGFISEADAETFCSLLPKFRKFFSSDKQLYEALCYDLKYDVRLRGLREQVSEPREWDDKSIVILCGEGYEEWGPHTLDKGMGGSEEAVVYLSRALAKQGYWVTVYGAVDEKITDNVFGVKAANNVTYRPWQEFDRRDKFNVFVAWRAPEFTEHVEAKLKLADVHDVLGKDRMKNYADVTYMVKSQYHRGLYPEIPDENIKVIGNGIAKEQFHENNSDHAN